MARKRETHLPPVFQYARIEKIVIYHVEESELVLLERGSADSLYLNFAIFLLSTCGSFLIALTATEIANDRVFTVFVVVAVVTGLGGVLLSALWWQSRRSVRTLFRKIRERLPKEEPIQELPTTSTEPDLER